MILPLLLLSAVRSSTSLKETEICLGVLLQCAVTAMQHSSTAALHRPTVAQFHCCHDKLDGTACATANLHSLMVAPSSHAVATTPDLRLIRWQSTPRRHGAFTSPLKDLATIPQAFARLTLDWATACAPTMHRQCVHTHGPIPRGWACNT
ncbi:hypothetical protein IQ06DRAFT_117065 [Phaeosphaeriaceae sp. SRC1lsM3a]|nr:hypothetical protein IQ06DRAFT_117065 [Stagonospora sp. SRC1lsM3a]